MRPDARPGSEHREFLEVLGALTMAHSDEDQRTGDHEERILDWYGEGLTARSIRAELRATTGIDVSLRAIAMLCESVGEELDEWRTTPLDAVCPILVIDTLPIKIRGFVTPESQVLFAVGVDCDGMCGVLGLWLGTKAGLSLVLDDLRSRGLADVCVLSCHPADGVAEAAAAVWPRALVQPWAAQLIRSSLRCARSRDHAAMRISMRSVFTAVDDSAAASAVDVLVADWGDRYPAVASLWRAHWPELAPMLTLPVDVRRPLYETSLVESVHRRLRDVARTHGAFASEQDVLTVLYLALRGMPELRNVRRAAPIANWKRTLQAFMTHFDGRLPLP